MAKKSIFVRFQKEGIHKYPEAGTDPQLADVSFLQYPHRHIFHFEVEVSVTHDNRDIEFIQFKRWLEGLYETGALQLDYKSCEMMADDIWKAIKSEYPKRDATITVTEDNENGARCQYDHTID